MSDLPPEPCGVEIRRGTGLVRILWDDDHESNYGLQYLRGYCPCAQCQGHSGGWQYVQGASDELVSIHQVGNYALTLTWADGHRTGIYSYEVLRNLCPCEGCMSFVGEKHPMRRMEKKLAIVRNQEPEESPSSPR